MNLSEITQQLTDYVTLANQLNNTDQNLHTSDDLIDSGLFDIEDQILTHYGLPHSFKYAQIIQELATINYPLSNHIKNCMMRLESAAREFFMAPILTDIELLRVAVEKQMEIDDVLPELSLKLQPEPYYWYCYYNLLLNKKITLRAFLNELKTVSGSDCSISINILRLNRPVTNNNPVYTQLQELKLQFLDGYLSEK